MVTVEGSTPDGSRASSSRSYGFLALLLFAIYMVVAVALYVFRGVLFRPDRWALLLFAGAVVLGRWKAFLRDWVPMVLLLFGYEFMRGLAFKSVQEGHRTVHLGELVAADRAIFGGHLPVLWLQQHLFVQGTLHWYDFLSVVVYAMFFVVPLLFAFYLWVGHKERFWQFTLALLAMTYVGFLIYLLYPAAPPWIADQWGVVHGVVLPFNQVWGALIPHPLNNLDQVTIWNAVAGNPVAAMPSLHAAYPWLTLLFALKFFGKRGLVFLPYNLAVWFSVVYLGQHWVIDILAGILLASLVFVLMVRVWPAVERAADLVNRRLARIGQALQARVAAAVGFPARAAASLGAGTTTRNASHSGAEPRDLARGAAVRGWRLRIAGGSAASDPVALPVAEAVAAPARPRDRRRERLYDAPTWRPRSRRLPRLALALLLGLAVLGALLTFVGPRSSAPDPPRTSAGWLLTPAGTQTNLGDFPMAAALSPDGRYLVVSNDGDGVQSLQVVDVSTSTVVQTVPYPAPQALYLGLAFAPDGRTLYAAAGGNNLIRVYSFHGGVLGELAPIALSSRRTVYPGGLALSRDGGTLYVANNLSSSISAIDTASRRVMATTLVGRNPYGVALGRDGRTLYVTNSGESSVTVLDAATLRRRATITVGLHPNALAVNPVSGDIYVSDSDSDQVSVIDAATDRVVRTLSLAPYPGALAGTSPDALAVSADGATLYVANAGNNDVAVLDLRRTGSSVTVGLIPTAWYPTGVLLDAEGTHLLVINGKGLGSGPNPGYRPGVPGMASQYVGTMMVGTLSTIPLPNAAALERYTAQVAANDRFPSGRGSVGTLPPIAHVIYVIKENRTYDQVFGDLPQGNGDPSLATFGAAVTPNLHRLAQQFVLFDNAYV
ncbi:MAG TPA: phosphatase PAP2 family protein, partial [Thermomicrobiaceae bacterium]|nr:phosphatase PAP2 family protein [Thermomicrobiaceae bacterium]